ncbi:MAG: hypothetical protein QOF60_3253 [Actinomycetota bacterium]|jgi:hypothetical protein|nr:hypothetical protein [Actinomycetota bacterium]
MLVTRIARTSSAALVAALLCGATLVLSAAPAGAQVRTGDIQSVGMSPTESKPDDPNAGQWFIFSIAPGQAAGTKARITNPADVPQTVKLYLADLVFGKDGTPSIPEAKPADIGLWGRFEQPVVTLQPHQELQLPFSLTVPADAEPGDHVGAVVAESAPIGDTVRVVKRIATRLYVTVPGDATKSFSILKVTKHIGSKWFPANVAVTTYVKNTGRVRIHPSVTVAGRKATGSDPLMARAVETYTAAVKIPWYGGPVSIPVEVATDAGTKDVQSSVFVVPLGLLASLPLAFLVMLGARGLWRLRARKLRGLQADLRRLEKLVAEKQTGEAAAKATLAGHGGSTGADDPEAERIRSIRAGIKRARRNHAQQPLERLALALHDTGEDALSELLAAIAGAEGDARSALVAAAASYGHDRLSSMAAGSVPDDVMAASAAPSKRRTRPAAADRAEPGAGTAPGSARRPRPPRSPAPAPAEKQTVGAAGGRNRARG